MKQNIKKQIKDLMGILNPASSYRYQYEERAGKYTLYYLNANKQQIVLADSITPEQMIAVLDVLVSKNDYDIPTLWPCMYEDYAKLLKTASAGIRSMLYNLVHDVGTVWFKRNPVIYVKTKDETFEPVHIQSLRWEDETVTPMAVNIIRSEEYSLDDGVAAETCARLLEEIVKQKLFEIK